jgi:flavin reductase
MECSMTGTRTPTEPDAASFRAAMACFPTGVALLTQGCGRKTEVTTISCLVSVSLDPLLLLVSIGVDRRIRARVSAGGSFAVNVLGAAQRELSVLFARPDRPAGEAAVRRLAAVPGITGNALVPSALASIECRLYAEYPGGDHVLFLGRVVAIHGNGNAEPPLVFHRSRYVRLAEGELS